MEPSVNSSGKTYIKDCELLAILSCLLHSTALLSHHRAAHCQQ